MNRFATMGLLVALTAGGCGGKSDDTIGGTGGNGGEDFYTCADNSNCIVVPTSCCGSCGAATRGDATAINGERTAEWRTQACGDDSFGCPACYGLPDPTLLATCRAERCALVDLKTDEASACTQDSDCRVRVHECCECGGDTSPLALVAVSDEGKYTSLVCDRDDACPECAPIYPSEVTARCEGGHCAVQDPRLP